MLDLLLPLLLFIIKQPFDLISFNIELERLVVKSSESLSVGEPFERIELVMLFLDIIPEIKFSKNRFK